MAVTAARLVDGLEEMVLYPRTDLFLLSIAAPGPVIRVVTEARPDDDGEEDTTERHGGRACAIELLATATPEAFEEELGGWMHPARRPYLEVTDDGWAQTRRLRLRSDQWAWPNSAEESPEIRRLQAQWRAPDGVWEAVDELTETISADIPSTVGFSAPMSAPLALDATSAAGALSIANAGNSPCHFVAKLYGPCTAPRLVNDLTGEELTFTAGLVLTAGQYVEVNSRTHTANLLSSASSSRLIYLDFEVSDWWRLVKGVQQVRYAPTDPTAGSAAVITYRPVWL
jgi:hypothetical protein